jgi:flagellar biosynthesis/type III secretory pathway chaperone
MNETIKTIESKLEGVLLVNLVQVLKQLDIQITEARKTANITNDYSKIMAMNSVRIAVINKIEEQDPSFHTKYVSEKVGA